MHKDLTAFKKHCQSLSKPIPILHYHLLETFFKGLKYFQRNYPKKIAKPISLPNFTSMMGQLPQTFNGLIWRLGLAMAWSAILRTSEWAIDYSTYKSFHTNKTIYFDKCRRSWPTISTVEMSIGAMKNWRQPVSLYFQHTTSPLSVPPLFEEVVNTIIATNDITVPHGEDPLLSIPRNTILLNFQPLIHLPENSLQKRADNKKLAQLATLANIHTKITGYSIRKGACAWAVANGCPPTLLQIIGRWSAPSYLEYITYTPFQLGQLSTCMVGQLPFKDAQLGAPTTGRPKGPFPWE